MKDVREVRRQGYLGWVSLGVSHHIRIRIAEGKLAAVAAVSAGWCVGGVYCSGQVRTRKRTVLYAVTNSEHWQGGGGGGGVSAR